ncbi:hypothetical protein [Dactylosporangium sp. NPDC048998]|uniref:hypothetical protein n=1 Tax=Dactylosporangium sp. NPDC048998 TaxID=3363976 RepID=UPI00371C5219
MLVGAAVAATVLTGGCGSSDTTGDACADVRSTLTRYTTDAPEYKAMAAEVEKGYNGTSDPGEVQAARDAYYKAFGSALRPIADEAKTPELKEAITNVADSYDRGHGDVQALDAILKQCQHQASIGRSTGAGRAVMPRPRKVKQAA